MRKRVALWGGGGWGGGDGWRKGGRAYMRDLKKKNKELTRGKATVIIFGQFGTFDKT